MEEARRWLRKAESDFMAAEINLEEGLFDVPAFLSHQAAEKSLKAVYIKRMKDLVKSHDLEHLAKLVRADTGILKFCRELNPHYVSSRYPFDVDYDKTISEKAIENSRRILKWSKKEMEE